MMKENWVYRRGDIYCADLDPVVGSEQGGIRPVIVIQNDTGNRYSPTLIVATVTTKIRKKENMPTHLLIRDNPAFKEASVVQLEQIRTIDKRRIDNYLGDVLSDEDNKELKKLYRKIVKALHPDINPDVSEAQVQLFGNAVSAYKNGDLGTLRIIGEMVGNNPLPVQHKDAMTQLVEERERLQGLLKSIRDSIENIKSEYPYTMKDILEDTEKTEQKKQELESILEQYNELISIYKAKIEEMLR